MKKSIWTPLTHAIYRDVRGKQELKGRRLGLAVSGGADSVALLCVFADLASVMNWQLHILHVHHGGRSSFRSRAAQFVERLGKEMCFSVSIVRSSKVLRSEAEMRAFRREAFRQCMRDVQLDLLVMGHHAQDLLETRLLRLLRGTGAQGLPAIQELSRFIWRPFLRRSPQDLREDLKMRGQEWIEDPSNQNLGYRRNWVRHVLLPTIEKAGTGSVNQIAASLENIVANLNQDMRPTDVSSVAQLKAWRPQDQSSWIASVYRRYSSRYTKSHIEEVRKRLLRSVVSQQFEVGGLAWKVDAGQLSFRSVARPQH